MGFRLDRRFVFDATPDAVWGVLSRPQDFPRWWTWLRRIDADGLTEGTTVRALIRAPIPWSLRLSLHIERVVPGERIDVRAGGDLEGPASLELAAHGSGTEARLVWDLEPRGRLDHAFGLVTRPVLQWGQDWVVNTGARQFQRRALRPPP
jgi:uncharacterized protein YndB with AHSA1/START domain